MWLFDFLYCYSAFTLYLNPNPDLNIIAFLSALRLKKPKKWKIKITS